MLRRIAFALAALSAGCPHNNPPPKIPPKVDNTAKDGKLLDDARKAAAAGDFETADKAYADAYKAKPDADIVDEYTHYLITSGHATKAVDVSKTYYDAHATDVKGYNAYCDALLAAGRGAEANDVADGILGFKADDPGGHEKKGKALILDDKIEPGLEELRKARDLDANNPAYHLSLGEALDKIGKIDEAQIEFRAAVKLAPDNVDAMVSLANALREQSNVDEAKGILDEAIKKDPKNGRAHFELGRLYNVLHMDKDAEHEFARAIQLAPNESLYWYAYGEIFRVQNRTDEQLAAYRKAAAIDPPYPKVLPKLGKLLVDRKEFGEAEKVLTLAAVKSKDPQVFLQLGDVSVGANHAKAALDSYEKYLELAPKKDPDRARVEKAVKELKSRP